MPNWRRSRPPRCAAAGPAGDGPQLQVTGSSPAGRRDGFPASGNAGTQIACQADHVGLRCLLVDDNTALLEAMSLLLEREGVTIVGIASSTAEALRQACAQRPDVVLVDISLGGENGFDLVRRLADPGRRGQMTMILISTRSETDYAELIAESPAAGFLPKSEVSATAIRRILSRS